MKMGANLIPALLLLGLFTGVVAAEDGAAARAPQPADAAPEPAITAAAPEAAESHCVAIARSAAPHCAHALVDTGSLAAAREQLLAKIEDLVGREMLSPDGAAEMRQLLADLESGLATATGAAAGTWTSVSPPALAGPGGRAGAWLTPLAPLAAPGSWSVLELRDAPLMLERQLQHGGHGHCPHAAVEAQPAPPAASEHAAALRELELKLRDGSVSVAGDGLSAEQLAEIERELAQAQASAADAGALVLKLRQGLPDQLAIELEGLNADSELPAELAELRALELEGLALQPMPREALLELEGLALAPLSLQQLQELHGAPGTSDADLGGELAEILAQVRRLAIEDEGFARQLRQLLETNKESSSSPE